MPIASINPATGETLKTFDALSAPQLDEKLQRAADTFLSFRDRGFDRLAHLLSHHLAQRLFIGLENLGGALHPRCALGHGRVAISAKRIRGELEFFFNLRCVERLESFQSLTRAWID